MPGHGQHRALAQHMPAVDLVAVDSRGPWCERKQIWSRAQAVANLGLATPTVNLGVAWPMADLEGLLALARGRTATDLSPGESKGDWVPTPLPTWGWLGDDSVPCELLSPKLRASLYTPLDILVAENLTRGGDGHGHRANAISLCDYSTPHFGFCSLWAMRPVMNYCNSFGSPATQVWQAK
ncbi:hypothetical protein Nepgr_033389 [Nepenthes gracilis]|uniref:Uncharacterized protein n=1 Tax=Nepenthes gracilis TaxID=150966 RepID=A0AAD3Y8C1_NEPGR|nr:hypothetical protein Nepgr_033389 [Nepenthes gracilis]